MKITSCIIIWVHVAYADKWPSHKIVWSMQVDLVDIAQCGGWWSESITCELHMTLSGWCCAKWIRLGLLPGSITVFDVGPTAVVVQMIPGMWMVMINYDRMGYWSMGMWTCCHQLHLFSLHFCNTVLLKLFMCICLRNLVTLLLFHPTNCVNGWNVQLQLRLLCCRRHCL